MTNYSSVPMVPTHARKLHTQTGPALRILEKDYGGEGGIRTHGTRKGSTVFETARFNRSRTSPFVGMQSLW
jgi:hypothetical protein